MIKTILGCLLVIYLIVFLLVVKPIRATKNILADSIKIEKN
ncbi:hypothetical protein [Methanohalobium sp.]|nr:hypothetical protein [Methanohalobium sp.]